MFKKTVTYVDYNGEERKEDFFFNLTKAEVAEMQLGTTGGLSELLRSIIDAKDTPSLIKYFKEIIRRSYGVKSLDGRRFMKSDELFEEFSQTEAYSEIFLELATNEEVATAFILGIIPADMANQLKESPEFLLNK